VYADQFAASAGEKFRMVFPLTAENYSGDALATAPTIMSVTLNERSELSHDRSCAVGLACHLNSFLLDRSCGVLRSFAF